MTFNNLKQALDSWDNLWTIIMWVIKTFDNLYGLLATCDNLWWIVLTWDDFWWLAMTCDNLWWLLTTFDEFWPFVTTYNDFWQIVMTCDNLWQLVTTSDNCDNLWQYVKLERLIKYWTNCQILKSVTEDRQTDWRLKTCKVTIREACASKNNKMQQLELLISGIQPWRVNFNNQNYWTARS